MIWKHSLRDRAAMELVRYLTNTQTLDVLAKAMVAMPPRLENLAAGEIAVDSITRQMAAALPNGRTYPTVGLWGVIEERLVAELLQIGEVLLINPDAKPAEVIQNHIMPLAQRLNISLEQRK